jgi:hypothetical protein
MELYKEWTKLAQTERPDQKSFWKDYFEKEMHNYESILESGSNKLEGKLTDLADGFNMDPVVFTGFLDGINTSLKEELDLDTLTEETELNSEIDFEKLYWNMHEAKADWLYNLKQWDGILSQERRNEITKEFRRSKMAVSDKVGRNDPCPCGSGKKYKKCCGK